MRRFDVGASRLVAVLLSIAVMLAARRAGAQDGGADPPPAQEEAEIAAELAQIAGHPGPSGVEAPPPPGEPGATASSRGLSNLMNPAISALGLLLAGYSTRDDAADGDERGDLATGPAIQEVEVALSAIVDPYFRADLVLAASADEIGFEEAVVTTLDIPRLTIRGGLFKAALGRHNVLHTHAFPFLLGPLPARALLGDEGLADPGVSFELLVPLPWFVELDVQVFDGQWPIFEGGVPDDPSTPMIDETVPDLRERTDLAYVARLRTLLDLADTTTLDLGASYVGGRNGHDGWTHVVAGDLTLKWRPIARARYTSLEWQTEWLRMDRRGAPGEVPTGGGSTFVRYQFDQRWWAQLRGAVLGVPGPRAARVLRGEALVALVPSEFSALRLQYGIERAEADGASLVHEVFLQMVFSIGPHPGHAY